MSIPLLAVPFEKTSIVKDHLREKSKFMLVGVDYLKKGVNMLCCFLYEMDSLEWCLHKISICLVCVSCVLLFSRENYCSLPRS
jgi:hypothetical protein